MSSGPFVYVLQSYWSNKPKDTLDGESTRFTGCVCDLVFVRQGTEEWGRGRVGTLV